jgi:hypothetical protein
MQCKILNYIHFYASPRELQKAPVGLVMSVYLLVCMRKLSSHLMDENQVLLKICQ